jgi:hypothetical protein
LSSFSLSSLGTILIFYKSGKFCYVFFLISLTWQCFLSTWLQNVWAKRKIVNHLCVLSTRRYMFWCYVDKTSKKLIFYCSVSRCFGIIYTQLMSSLLAVERGREQKYKRWLQMTWEMCQALDHRWIFSAWNNSSIDYLWYSWCIFALHIYETLYMKRWLGVYMSKILITNYLGRREKSTL